MGAVSMPLGVSKIISGRTRGSIYPPRYRQRNQAPAGTLRPKRISKQASEDRATNPFGKTSISAKGTRAGFTGTLPNTTQTTSKNRNEAGLVPQAARRSPPHKGMRCWSNSDSIPGSHNRKRSRRDCPKHGFHRAAINHDGGLIEAGTHLATAPKLSQHKSYLLLQGLDASHGV